MLSGCTLDECNLKKSFVWLLFFEKLFIFATLCNDLIFLIKAWMLGWVLQSSYESKKLFWYFSSNLFFVFLKIFSINRINTPIVFLKMQNQLAVLFQKYRLRRKWEIYSFYSATVSCFFVLFRDFLFLRIGKFSRLIVHAAAPEPAIFREFACLRAWSLWRK